MKHLFYIFRLFSKQMHFTKRMAVVVLIFQNNNSLPVYEAMTCLLCIASQFMKLSLAFTV